MLEAALAREPEDLAEAAERCEPSLDRLDRVEQPAEAVVLAPFRLEDDVEDQPDEHRDEHAEEQREREDVLELAGRADVVVLDDRGDRDADHPAEEPGDNERPQPRWTPRRRLLNQPTMMMNGMP